LPRRTTFAKKNYFCQEELLLPSCSYQEELLLPSCSYQEELLLPALLLARRTQCLSKSGHLPYQ